MNERNAPSGLERPTKWSPTDAPKDLPHVYVYPGQLLASAQAVIATTILGTCVAACLFDATTGIGGLNHFMLPETFREKSLRFGDYATRRLVSDLLALGAARGELRAKLFGGLSRGNPAAFQGDLGERNARAATRALAELEVPVVARDLGGPQSRKLVFHTGDGRAWVRRF